LLRSGLLFAPASKLTPSVERLHDRAAGKYASFLPDELPELANIARSAAIRTESAARMLNQILNQAFPLAIAEISAGRALRAPEL